MELRLPKNLLNSRKKDRSSVELISFSQSKAIFTDQIDLNLVPNEPKTIGVEDLMWLLKAGRTKEELEASDWPYNIPIDVVRAEVEQMEKDGLI